MKRNEFIESGILERYVMGHCTAAEIAEVNEAMANDTVIREEVAEIETALMAFAASGHAAPPWRVRENVLNRIQSPATTNNDADTAVRKMSPWRWIAAASIVLFLISVGVNVFLWNSNNNLNEQVAELQNENSVFAKELHINKAAYQETKDLIAFLSHTATKTITMNGLATSPDAKATIYWNTTTKETYCSVNSLNDPGEEYDYQLWAIVDGAPVSAGIVQSKDSIGIMQKMASFDHAAAFAITIEKKGGSPTPTLEKMVVIGNV